MLYTPTSPKNRGQRWYQKDCNGKSGSEAATKNGTKTHKKGTKTAKRSRSDSSGVGSPWLLGKVHSELWKSLPRQAFVVLVLEWQNRRMIKAVWVSGMSWSLRASALRSLRKGVWIKEKWEGYRLQNNHLLHYNFTIKIKDTVYLLKIYIYKVIIMPIRWMCMAKWSICKIYTSLLKPARTTWPVSETPFIC